MQAAISGLSEGMMTFADILSDLEKDRQAAVGARSMPVTAVATQTPADAAGELLASQVEWRLTQAERDGAAFGELLASQEAAINDLVRQAGTVRDDVSRLQQHAHDDIDVDLAALSEAHADLAQAVGFLTVRVRELYDLRTGGDAGLFAWGGGGGAPTSATDAQPRSPRRLRPGGAPGPPMRGVPDALSAPAPAGALLPRRPASRHKPGRQGPGPSPLAHQSRQLEGWWDDEFRSPVTAPGDEIGRREPLPHMPTGSSRLRSRSCPAETVSLGFSLDHFPAPPLGTPLPAAFAALGDQGAPPAAHASPPDPATPREVDLGLLLGQMSPGTPGHGAACRGGETPGSAASPLTLGAPSQLAPPASTPRRSPPARPNTPEPDRRTARNLLGAFDSIPRSSQPPRPPRLEALDSPARPGSSPDVLSHPLYGRAGPRGAPPSPAKPPRPHHAIAAQRRLFPVFAPLERLRPACTCPEGRPGSETTSPSPPSRRGPGGGSSGSAYEENARVLARFAGLICPGCWARVLGSLGASERARAECWAGVFASRGGGAATPDLAEMASPPG